jgi:hypothetical protein
MRVKQLAEPVAVEPPRSGEDAADCVACNSPDEAYIWVSERWRVRAMDRPTGLPMVLILECRSHLDLGDLPNLLAAELGVMTVRLERAVRSLDGVARVHVNRWGDGSAHLHLWFLARPLGRLQLRGTFLSLWDDILPVIPETQWRENLALVAAWLAEFGGRPLAEPPHIQWQSPSTLGERHSFDAAARLAADQLEDEDLATARRATTTDFPVEASEPKSVGDPATTASPEAPLTRSGDEPSRDEPSRDEPSRDEPSRDEPSRDEPSDHSGDERAGWESAEYRQAGSKAAEDERAGSAKAHNEQADGAQDDGETPAVPRGLAEAATQDLSANPAGSTTLAGPATSAVANTVTDSPPVSDSRQAPPGGVPGPTPMAVRSATRG